MIQGWQAGDIRDDIRWEAVPLQWVYLIKVLCGSTGRLQVQLVGQ